MFYYTIIITIICLCLLFRNKKLKSRLRLDGDQIGKNREEVLKLALDDYNSGGIPKKILNYFSHVCHPYFRDWMDSVPMDRASYERAMRKADSEFWRTYKLTPDFKIDPKIVYAIYKKIVEEGFKNRPDEFEDPQFKSRSAR